MIDKLLGRKTRYNWGKNSKRELRNIEMKNFRDEILEELCQDEEDRIEELRRKEYDDYIANHWANNIC